MCAAVTVRHEHDSIQSWHDMGYRYRVLVTVHTILPLHYTTVSRHNMRICCAEVDCFLKLRALLQLLQNFPCSQDSQETCGSAGGRGAGLEVARTVATSRLYRGGGGGPGSAGQLVLDTAWHSDTSVFSPASSSTADTSYQQPPVTPLL